MARSKLRPEINITPLVDVVLVLLIIFMVVAPQMEAGQPVKLPAIGQADASQAMSQPITVTLTREGRTYLEKDEVSDEVLLARLKEIHQAQPQARVVLKADTRLPYGKVRSVFRQCQELGFPGASLQVTERSNTKG